MSHVWSERNGEFVSIHVSTEPFVMCPQCDKPSTPHEIKQWRKPVMVGRKCFHCGHRFDFHDTAQEKATT